MTAQYSVEEQIDMCKKVADIAAKVPPYQCSLHIDYVEGRWWVQFINGSWRSSPAIQDDLGQACELARNFFRKNIGGIHIVRKITQNT